MRGWRMAGVGVGALGFAAGAWLLQRTTPETQEIYRKARTLDEVITRVADYYVDSLDEAALYQLAIDGMLERINDPYSDFLELEELEELSAITSGDYTGLGLRIEASGGFITVVAPLSDSPADSAGMLPGDRIIAVDGEPIVGWSADKTALTLRGDAGTSVALTVQRPGIVQSLTFELERAPIHVSAVRFADTLTPSVGYVRLELISEESAAELAEAIRKLRTSGARSLLLDLRGNPGGLLQEGIAAADLFLDAGDVVVETRSRHGPPTQTYQADFDERWPEMPVAVLVNRYSASAAEIIAGALQDHGRALIIGERTFGKGLVQGLFPFGRDQALKLTIGRWYTPDGRSIQREGLRSPPEWIALLDSAESPDATVVGPEPSTPDEGGILPDVNVRDRPLTREAVAFRRALGSNAAAFDDAASSLARELDDTFEPSAAVRRRLRRSLSGRGITLRETVWSDAADYVDEQITLRVLRYTRGRDAELRREIMTDPLVGRAIDYLERAETPDALLELANADSLTRG